MKREGLRQAGVGSCRACLVQGAAKCRSPGALTPIAIQIENDGDLLTFVDTFETHRATEATAEDGRGRVEEGRQAVARLGQAWSKLTCKTERDRAVQ